MQESERPMLLTPGGASTAVGDGRLTVTCTSCVDGAGTAMFPIALEPAILDSHQVGTLMLGVKDNGDGGVIRIDNGGYVYAHGFVVVVTLLVAILALQIVRLFDDWWLRSDEAAVLPSWPTLTAADGLQFVQIREVLDARSLRNETHLETLRRLVCAYDSAKDEIDEEERLP